MKSRYTLSLLVYAALAPFSAVAAAAESGEWTNVTPAQIAITGNDNYGIQDILVDPTHLNTLYAFTCRFGAWKSTDYGQTWKKISADGGPLDQGKAWGEAMAPDGSYMLATLSGSTSVFKSIDGGVTWTPAPTTIHPYNVDIEPADKNHVVGAGHDETHLIESTDAGQTWTDQGPMGGATTSCYVHFLLDGNTVLTVSADRPDAGSWRGVKSDGKWTWTRVSDQDHDHGSHQIFIDRKTKAIYHPGPAPGLGILKSTDNGLTWTSVSKEAADAIVATPTTIYACRSFPIQRPFEPHFQHAARSNDTNCVADPKPAGMENGAKCLAVTYDGKNYILVSGNWCAGLWRYVEPAQGTAGKATRSSAPATEQRPSAAKALTIAEGLYKHGKLAEAATAFQTAQNAIAELADRPDSAKQLAPLVKRLITLHDNLALDGAKVPAIAVELPVPMAGGKGTKIRVTPVQAKGRRGGSASQYSDAMPPYTGEWTVISDGILAELGKTHPVSNDTFARMTAGIAVDRTNGDVYLMANNIGICKSTDQGQTFELVSDKTVTGRFETAWGIDVDPEGKRLMCFSIYGSSGYSGDAGKTWIQSKQGHLDFGAVDWSDTGESLLAVGHESGGKLYYSADAGKSWKMLGTNYWGAGMFDHATLLSGVGHDRSGRGIVRSTDGGENWKQVSEEKLAAPVMVGFKGVGYWLGEKGLLVSKDKGATWSNLGPVPNGACVGPMFGADPLHMVVGSPDGLYQSNDGGKNWVLAVPPAPDIKIRNNALWANYAWDPIHNIFYASQMSKPAYRFVAKAAK
jgi:photosystem II stability/assembly factor-like uncharacterized protein